MKAYHPRGSDGTGARPSWEWIVTEQSGQVLPLVLILLVLGALVVIPFLAFASTSLKSTASTAQNVQEYYAADAGAEHAVWRLRNQDLSTMGLDVPGASYTYAFTQSLNNITPTVAITRIVVDAAEDDFESATATGGQGWLASWGLAGSGKVNKGNQAFGAQNLQVMNGSSGSARRDANLSGLSNVHLRFWAMAQNFGVSDSVVLMAGPASNLTTVMTWTSADSGSTLHFYDLDLSSYSMASDFAVVFNGSSVSNKGAFFVDNIQLVQTMPATYYGLPADDFETGGATGGYGWNSGWNLGGNAHLTTTGSPHRGSYHLMLSSNNGNAKRAGNLLGLSNVRLQFWAKASSWTSGDQAVLQVSPDNKLWLTANTWTTANSDNTYHFYDIDLSPYALSASTWISFVANMSSSSNLFYVDDLRVVGPTTYQIVSVGGSLPLLALVQLRGSTVVPLSWMFNPGGLPPTPTPGPTATPTATPTPSYAHQYTDSDAHDRADADQHAHAYTYQYAYAYTYQHAYAYTYHYSDAHDHADPDSDAHIGHLERFQ